MSPELIKAHFTRKDGQFAFARWGRPVATVAFGLEECSLLLLKEAVKAVLGLADHAMAATDPEIGSNLMFFFFKEWQELRGVPKLDCVVPELSNLVQNLENIEANQYRLFRFDNEGGIKACFVFLKMDENLKAVSANTLCLSQVVQSTLLWSDCAFQSQSPLAVLDNGQTILRPEIADLIKAAYAPELPAFCSDASHAFRLFARMNSKAPVS